MHISSSKFKFNCFIFLTEMHDIIYNLYVVRFWREGWQTSIAYRAVHLNTKHKDMNTVNYRYNTVEYYMILKTARKWRKRNFTQTKNSLRKDTPHLALSGEPWGVPSEFFAKNTCDIESVLYFELKDREPQCPTHKRATIWVISIISKIYPWYWTYRLSCNNGFATN